MTLDGKGRITVPARWCEQLKTRFAGQLVVAKGHSRCLTLYPLAEWTAFEAELAKLPMQDEGWIDFFLGSATDVEIDSASRILVPPELRDWAGLKGKVKFMGVGRKFQLWDVDRYAEREAQVMAAGLPDSLQKLVRG